MTKMNDTEFDAELCRRTTVDVKRQMSQIELDRQHEQECQRKRLSRLRGMNDITQTFPEIYRASASATSQEIAKREYDENLASKLGYTERQRKLEIQFENTWPNGYGPKSPKKRQ